MKIYQLEICNDSSFEKIFYENLSSAINKMDQLAKEAKQSYSKPYIVFCENREEYEKNYKSQLAKKNIPIRHVLVEENDFYKQKPYTTNRTTIWINEIELLK